VRATRPTLHALLGQQRAQPVTPLLQKNAGFDPIKDFAPVSMVAKSTMVLAVAVPACRATTVTVFSHGLPAKSAAAATPTTPARAHWLRSAT